jgi:ABC-2 type transport system ATP-binding protein
MLQVKEICKSYRDQQVLKNVSFQVNPGERVALLGANGAGKTTTIRAICTLIEYEKGDILFDGEPIKKKKDYLSCIGAVLEGRQNLNWRLSVAENAYYAAGIRGVAPADVKANLKEITQQLGLEQYGKRIVGQLSSGNRQKAALASVLSYEPKLLLLDEPTLGLDVAAVDDLSNIIIDQSNQHERGLIITSHDMGFIDKVCTRVVVLSHGEVFFDGSKEDIRTNFFKYVFKLNLPNNDIKRLIKDNEIHLQTGKLNWNVKDDSFFMEYDDIDRPLPLINWIHKESLVPKELQISPISLEEAYKNSCVINMVA